MPEMTVRLSGPLFEANAPGIAQQMAANMVRELTELGVERLTSAFPQGLPVLTGNLRRNVSPMIAGPMARISDGGVIYSAWIEGTSSRNETTRFKGYSTWRRAYQWLVNEQVPKSTEKWGAKLAEALNGGL